MKVEQHLKIKALLFWISQWVIAVDKMYVLTVSLPMLIVFLECLLGMRALFFWQPLKLSCMTILKCFNTTTISSIGVKSWPLQS